MKELALHLKVFRRLLTQSLMAALAYLGNGWLIILGTTLEIFSLLAFLEIAFGRTDSVAGWSQSQVFLFYAIYLLESKIFDFLFGSGLPKIGQSIESGRLDMILLRPTRSLFLASFNVLHFFSLIGAAFALLIIGYAAAQAGITITPLGLLAFSLVFVSGLVIHYSIAMMILTLAFWTIRTPFYHLLRNLVSINRLPLDIFGRGWQVFFTFFLPLIFVVTVPAKAMMGLFSQLTYLAPIVALFLLLLTASFGTSLLSATLAPVSENWGLTGKER